MGPSPGVGLNLANTWTARVRAIGIDPPRVVFIVGSAVGAILLVYFLVLTPGQGVDAYAYWRASRGDPYSVDIGTGAFHYAPPVAQLLELVSAVPWPAFYWIWTACSLAMLVWIGRRWALAIIAFPPVIFELFHGNIHVLLAIVVALAIRWPALWAAVLLTKITPGVALVWHAARGEWRALLWALGATFVVSVASLMLSPTLWPDWIRHLEVAGGLPGPWYLAVPLPIRLVAAGVLTIWGARSDREWVLPIAVTLSLPILWLNGLTILVALVPLLRRRSPTVVVT